MSKKVFLIGVCGVGMSALAVMLKKKGYEVHGSDTGFYPPASDFLKDNKVKLFEGWNPDNIKKDYDFVVIGNVCRKDNPEVLKLHELKLEHKSLPDTIRDIFIEDRESAVVTGTHGKTTTTAILSWIFETAGGKYKPSFMVGGIPLNFGTNHQVVDTDYFVIEGDEYDSVYYQKNPKFLHYRPKHVIISSIEFDHFDIYPDMESYLNAFRDLLKILPEGHTLVANGDYPDIRKILNEYPQLKPEFYSTVGEDAHWTVKNLKYELHESSFDVLYKGELVDRFQTSLVGEFNISNILSAIALATNVGLPKNSIKEAIKSFSGVKRRQERIGTINDAVIIEDFAHHPTAVSGVLKAFKRIENRKDIWAIFEPRSATARRKIFEKEFLEALSLADKVILPDPIDRGDIPKEKLFSSVNVVKELNSMGKTAYKITDVDEIVEKISSEANPSDIIIIMSNGGFGGIYQKLLSKGRK